MEDGDAKYNILERILDGTAEPTDLPFQLLESITENFSEQRKIGVGGFGEVFEGVLENRSVAVKRIQVNSITVDDSKFVREVLSQFNIKHPNIVRFLGFCSQSHHQVIKGIGPHKYLLPLARERLLCFEYISNGSLAKHITDELRGMEWNARFQIIKGICQGLRYLHEVAEIIHMDLNPKNIMVDDDMVPKITDFGLARLAENPHTTGPRLFTPGYCAPEYQTNGDMTFKCDMYSLGATIVELVTGRKGDPDKTNVLRRWKWSYKWNISARKVPLQTEQVTKCIEIAERCMRKEPARRPSISKIMSELNEIENTSGDIMDGHVSSSAPKNHLKE